MAKVEKTVTSMCQERVRPQETERCLCSTWLFGGGPLRIPLTNPNMYLPNLLTLFPIELKNGQSMISGLAVYAHVKVETESSPSVRVQLKSPEKKSHTCTKDPARLTAWTSWLWRVGILQVYNEIILDIFSVLHSPPIVWLDIVSPIMWSLT